MVADLKMSGADINITELIPLNTREINLKKNRGYRRIVSSINAIGLIEPLCVYKENGHYLILDGFLRYKACEELGFATVPCLLYQNKEAYTFNKMINSLSPVQQSRMIRESLKTLDRSKVANVFGIKSVQHRLGTQMLKQLDPKVLAAVDGGTLSRRCAMELVHVKWERQQEILREMEKTEDYSISFARAMVIKTANNMRNRSLKKKRPWGGDTAKKQELVAKLEAVTKRHDFYINLYRQYSADLLKLHVYVRKIITNEKIREYLSTKYIEILKGFEKIVFDTEGNKAI